MLIIQQKRNAGLSGSRSLCEPHARGVQLRVPKLSGPQGDGVAFRTSCRWSRILSGTILMKFSQTAPPSTIVGKKRGSGGGQICGGKNAHRKPSCEFTHICMLTFLRSPTSISEQIISQLKGDFSKLLKRQNPLPFFKAAT